MHHLFQNAINSIQSRAISWHKKHAKNILFIILLLLNCKFLLDTFEICLNSRESFGWECIPKQSKSIRSKFWILLNPNITNKFNPNPNCNPVECGFRLYQIALTDWRRVWKFGLGLSLVLLCGLIRIEILLQIGSNTDFAMIRISSWWIPIGNFRPESYIHFYTTPVWFYTFQSDSAIQILSKWIEFLMEEILTNRIKKSIIVMNWNSKRNWSKWWKRIEKNEIGAKIVKKNT